MSPHAPESVAPTRTDPVAAAASEIIGGPLGRYAALARHTAGPAWQPAAAVLVALSSLTVAFGVLQKGHCFTKGWNNPDQFWHACYSDLPVSSDIGHAMPYLSGAPPLDQPLISGLVMWLVGLVSVDLLGVLLAAVAMRAWGRKRVASAGFMLGLAISARSYPLVLLVAIGLLAVRSGRVGAWRRLAGTALATWFAVSLPWLVMNADGLLSVYRSWWRGGASYGSVWMVSGLLGQSLPQSRLTVLVIAGWLAALAVGAFFALSLDRRPTVAEVSLVMLVVVLVTGKSVPVQAGLWLVPLIALIGLQWRDHLVWAAFESTYFVAVWLYIAGLSKPDRGLPRGPYSLLLVLRLAAMLFVVMQVWRVARARGPGDEVDPLAGPMAGAPDRVLVHLA